VIPDSAAVFWMLVAFVVTFAVTRVITNLIRRGRGPFRDMSVGGVHIHHQVWGIFLLLGVGTMELAYRPASPWLEVLAVLFGMGAALTLDEFALWLRLDDVYWGPEGRRSDGRDGGREGRRAPGERLSGAQATRLPTVRSLGRDNQALVPAIPATSSILAEAVVLLTIGISSARAALAWT